MGGPTHVANQQVQLNPGFGAVRQVQNAMMGRLQPQMDYARQAEINRLKAQGITENSDAWGRAMDTLNRGDNDARNQALLGATQAYGDIFNRGLAQNNQVFGQGMQNKQFGLAKDQFGLQRQNQRWNQGFQERGQDIGRNQFNRQFGLAQDQFGLQRQNQRWNQGFQEENQDISRGQFNKQFGLQQQNQNWNQRFQNRGQQFGQDLAGAQFANQSNQQRFGQNQAQQQMMLQLRQQQLQEQMSRGNLTLAQRQQLMAEQNNPYQQMMWLNSMQNNPQFNGYTTAGQGSGVDYSGAGQNQYQGNLGNWNAQTAANNGMISGIGQLLGGWGQNQIAQGGGGGGATGGWGGLLGGIGDIWKQINGGT